MAHAVESVRTRSDPSTKLSGVQCDATSEPTIVGLMARKADIIRLLVEEAGAVASVMPIQFDFPMHLAMDAIQRGGHARDTAMPPGTVCRAPPVDHS